MNLYQIRQEVRRILRDDEYPAESVNAAINRVIADINILGRFKFHQLKTELTLVAGTYKYAEPSDMLSEKVLVWAEGTTSEHIVRKRNSVQDMLAEGKFTAQGDVPNEYCRFGGYVYLDPIPSSTAAASKVMVYYWGDLQPLVSDTDTPDIPERYHRNVLSYGAAAQINPVLEVGSTQGMVNLNTLYERAVRSMASQELWDVGSIPTVQRGARWANSHNWGTRQTMDTNA